MRKKLITERIELLGKAHITSNCKKIMLCSIFKSLLSVGFTFFRHVFIHAVSGYADRLVVTADGSITDQYTGMYVLLITRCSGIINENKQYSIHSDCTLLAFLFADNSIYCVSLFPFAGVPSSYNLGNAINFKTPKKDTGNQFSCVSLWK
jgi:hypothetical protein